MQLCGRWFPAAEKPRRTANSRSPSLQPINFPDFFWLRTSQTQAVAHESNQFKSKFALDIKSLASYSPWNLWWPHWPLLGTPPIDNWDALPYSRRGIPVRFKATHSREIVEGTRANRLWCICVSRCGKTTPFCAVQRFTGSMVPAKIRN